jgi:hypothetical protein
MDLGLAQVADEVEGRLTRTRQFVGTLRYASPEQVLAVGGLGRCTRACRAAEAEPLLRECLATREAKLPAGSWRQEAEPLVLSGYEGLSEATGAPRKQVTEALDRVIDLYETWGKPTEAAAWKKERPTPPG